MGGRRFTKPSVIYAIQCVENGKVYIGKTQCLERRIKQHFTEKAHESKLINTTDKKHGIVRSKFAQDFNKYGPEKFRVFVLEENVDPDRSDDRERFWINEYNAEDERFGYNRTGKRESDCSKYITPGLPKNISKDPCRAGGDSN